MNRDSFFKVSYVVSQMSEMFLKLFITYMGKVLKKKIMQRALGRNEKMFDWEKMDWLISKLMFADDTLLVAE